MIEGEGTIRAFIAVALPAALNEALGGVQQEMKRVGAEARWVRPQGIHLTLKFLGDTQVEQVPSIRLAMDEAARGSEPFEVHIKGVGVFPNERRPRVIWVGLEEPTGALASLQKNLEAALRPLGFKPEGRPFKGHLTLARIKAPGRTGGVLRALEVQKDLDLGKMHLDRIVLYKSTLKPTGAVYDALEEVVLGAA